MSKIILIAIDMDGTILNELDEITDYTKDMIKQAEQAGIHVVISTGRPLATCISYVRDLELSSYVITSNGAEIYTTDEELIEQHIMHPEKMEQLCHIRSEEHTSELQSRF